MYDVTLKPTGMSRKKNGQHRRTECVIRIAATDTNEAARLARQQAESEGFAGYAITKIKEVSQ